MPTLATTVDGLKLPNPFIIGSGPPGDELECDFARLPGRLGAVIAKTVSLDSSKGGRARRCRSWCRDREMAWAKLT